MEIDAVQFPTETCIWAVLISCFRAKKQNYLGVKIQQILIHAPSHDYPSTNTVKTELFFKICYSGLYKKKHIKAYMPLPPLDLYRKMEMYSICNILFADYRR